jgi:predicted ATPase
MIAFYNPEEHRSLAFVIGQDPAVLHLSYQAWTLWFLGYPDQALKRSHEAIALAQGLDHPFSLALAFCMAGWMHMSRREARATRERAEAAIRIAAPKGFFVFQSGGIGLRGWVQVEEGAIEEGIAEIRQGLAGWRATGTEFHRPHFLTWLAEAYAKAGQVQEGLAQLAEALELVEKTGERYHRAEIHRLKADLLWMQGNGVEAEAHYWAAIQVARQQSAKSLELRTTMRLSRLLQARGKQEQARQLLSDIYGWFTEGFDTPDLKDARALLDELS